jgi:hypothetical protein
MHKTFVSALTLMLTFISGMLLAQSPEERVMKDYPKLYNDFKSQVGAQKAHYIIAIDISSSMKSMEASVKSNLKNFLSALPDGDKITLIQMANEAETKIVNLTDYTEIKSSTRSNIISYIANLKFKKKGETGDGSDGYTMTELIVDALKKPGSSADMKYVFVFSDFEYYDKNKFTGNDGYNKNALPWKSLKSKIDKDSKARVFGLIIKSPKETRAVYESELKDIFSNFSKVECPDDAAILNMWFETKKSEILRDRLAEYLTKKIENQKDALVLKASGLGKELSISPKTPELSVVFTEAELDATSLAEVQKTSESRPLIGSFSPKARVITVKAKPRAPKYTNLKHPAHTPSDPYNEVDKLLKEVNKLPEPQFAEYKIEVYEGKPYLAWYIGWPLVALLVFWIGSIVLQLLTFKSKKSWRIGVQVYEADEFSRDIDNQTFNNLPKIEIGNSASQYRIDDCGFDISIEIRKNVLLPFYKSGYFLVKKSGVSKMNYKLTGKLESAINKETFLCKQSKFKGCTIEVIRMDLKYKIRVI